MESIKRFLNDCKQSYFLFGPRGTGKSTWLKETYPQSLYLDLLSPEVFRTYSARPEQLEELVKGNKDKHVVIIDEIQKLPSLLPLVHRLIEELKTHRFVLTGSSARKLRRSGIDLLGGRALLKAMHPFLAAELGDAFNMQKALTYGLIPLIVSSSDSRASLEAYISLYIREEVQAESLVRNIGDFSRFLETMSFSHGSVLNASQIARDCHIGRKTVEGYIAVLEDLLLGFKVNVFTKRAKRLLQSHPKFYFFDVGVFRTLRPQGPLDIGESLEGAALEGLVAQHLKAWISYSRAKAELYYWRTKAKNEVDFVVYGDAVFLAIEVKNSLTIRPRDLSGLKSFGEDYPEAQRVLVYRGKEKLMKDGVLCMPCDLFLKSIVPNSEIV